MSRKLALIIGNNDYSDKPLINCVNDATSLAEVLRRVENCQVELKTNLKSEDMYTCIQDFTASIKRNDFIIFFFAGHGIQWGDQNFLLPCDNSKIKSGNDMQRYAINAQMIVNGMAEMDPHIVLFLLDCCRSYWMPLKTLNNRAMNQQVGGLNQMRAPRQTLIAFACAAGEVASDQSEASNNGLFTKYLLKHITTPNEHIETILRRVANDIAIETDHSQLSFRVSSIISDEVYLTSHVQPKQEISVNKKTPIVTQLEKLSLRVDPGSSPKQEINILLLGITGVGKSTFINALANYLLNDTLEEATHEKLQVLIPISSSYTDPDTFDEKTISIGKQDEYENWDDDAGQSCTKKCRSFVFSIGDRLLRLIDTPPVGDTRGFEQDIKNLDEIITYIARYEYLNGICILLKPNEEWLTVLFRYCVTGLLRHLPKSAMANIMFVFTNARSTFFKPGSTKKILQALINQYQQEHGVQIPFTKENTFFVDNEPVRYLALRLHGIHLDDECTQSYIKSWNHTVKEYALFIAYITTRPLHIVRDTVSLYEVQQLISILTSTITKLSSFSQINKRMNDPRNEKTKIEDVYRKLCKFIQINAIVPYNDNILDYIRHIMREEEMKQSSGTNNTDVIHHLEMLYSNYANEMNLLKKTIEDERRSGNKTDLIEAKDIFPLVSTLYDLPINGDDIRKQIEESKINPNKIEQRENFVQLPAKANSSKLTRQLKDDMSKS